MRYGIRMASAGVVAMTAAATMASAADLPGFAPAPAPVIVAPPAFSLATFLSGFYAHVGPAGVIIDAGAKVYTPAGRIPGATIKVPPQVTATAEIGYRFTPNWAVSVTLGVPPTATNEGAGTITALGKLGTNTYGPTAVTAHYHFTQFGRFQPYIGGGPVYMIAFNTTDGAVSNYQVQSAWGVTGQVGADYMINDHLGFFVDLKKAYLRTTAHGVLGVPIHADVKLDPYVISGGLTYRF